MYDEMVTKKYLLAIGIFLAGIALGFGLSKVNFSQQIKFLSPLGSPGPKEKPLDKYTFENLRKREYGSEIIWGETNNGVTKFMFNSDGRKVSGVARGIQNKGKVIIMLHGFASQEEYYPGFGTERVAAALAESGYVTLAPDFLGFGSSDKASADGFEDRFQTYTSTLNLLAATKKWCESCQIGIWGHSNGGQIALSVLEISGEKYPTVLWNPVTRSFPFNILFFTDSFEDQGKGLRKALAGFEEDYDVEKYSTPNFVDWISAPILLQQGSEDPWVPQKWSDQFAETLKKHEKTVSYKVYLGADHNLVPKWNEAVGDLMKFYKSTLSQ